jgi:hypothetical protein
MPLFLTWPLKSAAETPSNQGGLIGTAFAISLESSLDPLPFGIETPSGQH